MKPLILSGKDASAALLDSLKPLVEKLDPKLVVIQVGEDPASASYIRQKVKSCDRIGIRNEHIHMAEETTKDELFRKIIELNSDPDVTGFFVQLPLPKHLQEFVPQIIRSIDPTKDIDGFHAYNVGKTFLSKDFEHLPPATPSGIVQILKHYNIDVAGKHVVIVGRSNTVGKPVGTMLLNRNATVTICHSKTVDMKKLTLQADILIAAVGKPKMITADMVKEGVIVIDVGINRTEEGLKGDTDFEEISKKAAAITPVPGGVGPMTVACLLQNCVRAKQRQIEHQEGNI